MQRRYICVQIGARRDYAVPAILEGAGLLDRLYTDMCGNVGIGRVLSRFPPVMPALSRLASRRVPDAVRPKTYTFALPVARDVLRSIPEGRARLKQGAEFRRDLAAAMIKAGIGPATHVLSLGGEGHSFLAQARRHGLRVISDVYLVLSAENIVAEERRAFPGWEAIQPAATPDLERALIERSDFFLCPSEIVRDDLVANWGVDPGTTRLVSYGLDPAWLQIEPLPVLGRILFVGTADLRKGIHYFAMATEILRRRGHAYEFRVAGDAADSVRLQRLCGHLDFLGRIPRDRINSEFQRADILVLPSLAEGSAEVTYQALAAAVPVVATAAAGSVVRDGLDGLIVAERDPRALADAIESIVEDRALRTRMAASARERALDFTWHRSGERLLSALADIG